MRARTPAAILATRHAAPARTAAVKPHPLIAPLSVVAAGTLLLLMVPLVAMQLTREVAWGPEDFLVGGSLLFAAGAAIVLSWRKLSTTRARIGAASVIGLALLAIWAELAVGLFH